MKVYIYVRLSENPRPIDVAGAALKISGMQFVECADEVKGFSSRDYQLTVVAPYQKWRLLEE